MGQAVRAPACLQVSVCRSDTETCTAAKVTEVFTYKDFARQKVDSASAGDIVAVAGAPPPAGFRDPALRQRGPSVLP